MEGLWRNFAPVYCIMMHRISEKGARSGELSSQVLT